MHEGSDLKLSSEKKLQEVKLKQTQGFNVQCTKIEISRGDLFGHFLLTLQRLVHMEGHTGLCHDEHETLSKALKGKS